MAGGRPWRCRWAKTFATCGARMHQLPFCVAGGAQKCPPATVWCSTCGSMAVHLRQFMLFWGLYASECMVLWGWGVWKYVEGKGRLPVGAVRDGREGGRGAGRDGQWGARRIRRVLVTFAVPANRALGRKLTPKPHPRGKPHPTRGGMVGAHIDSGMAVPSADAGRRLVRTRRSFGVRRQKGCTWGGRCLGREKERLPEWEDVSGEGGWGKWGRSRFMPGTFTRIAYRNGWRNRQ